MNRATCLIELILLLVTGFFLNSCDTIPGFGSEESVAGVYFLHGQQINYQYCFNAETCELDTFFPTDTIQTSFTTRVYVVWDKKDTLRFTGLEGADIAVRERFVNIGPPADTNCEGDAQCAYANYSDNKLEFRFDAYGSAYFGTGTLDDGTLELQTYFEYRSARIGYELEGAKIKDVQ